MTTAHDDGASRGENRRRRSARRSRTTDRLDHAETAGERFHDAYRTRLAVGILIAVAAHFVMLEAAPVFRVGLFEGGAADLEAVELPPHVEVPPPPERMARPATPTVATADVDEDVTIAPTTFDANPAERLPPPPKTEGTSPGDRPSFIPRDVDPRLENEREVHRLLMRYYPTALREAGIGGRVVIWIFVDRTGDVTRAQVHTPSDYAAFDEAALKVAQQMEFRPAINRDRPIGVWVSQSIRFSVERG